MKRPFITILALYFSSVACINASCDEDSRSVTFARSLTSKQLEDLYVAYESHIESAPDGKAYRLRNIMSPRHYPEGFEVIEWGVIKPMYGRITLEGCFDSFVTMSFTSIGLGASNERKIVLDWGEGSSKSGSEVLWQE